MTTAEAAAEPRAPLGPDSPIVMTGATVSLNAFITWATSTRRELRAV
jgi:hypothetical protein